MHLLRWIAARAGVTGLVWALAAGLPLAAAPVGATATPPASTVPAAHAYAAAVLGQAHLPPGAQPTTAVVTSFLTVEPEPFLFPSGARYDANALYTVALPPAAVTSYVESHSPRGTWAADQGPPPPGITTIAVEVPVAGPNHEDAQDTYTIAADGTGSEVRIDAWVIWVPDRPRTEHVPPSDSVVVTAYTAGSAMRGAYEPVTVRVTGTAATTIRRAFDALPRAAAPADCMEFVATFRLAFFAAGASKPAFTALTTGCAGTVDVSDPAGQLDPLRGDCTLTLAVLAVVPRTKGASSRRSAARCLAHRARA